MLYSIFIESFIFTNISEGLSISNSERLIEKSPDTSIPSSIFIAALVMIFFSFPENLRMPVIVAESDSIWIFDDLKSKIPETKILIPGVVDSTSNFVEHQDLIYQRLEKFINIVGIERVIAGSDCGFGTFPGYGNVDEDIVFEKLKSMVVAAKRF